jgi:hypothetical protein
MKALLIFFVCVCTLATVHAQSTTPAKTADTAKPKPITFVIVMNQNELSGLFNFIQNANLYSAEGRQLELDDLKKHVAILPAVADSAKPDSATKAKPKK